MRKFHCLLFVLKQSYICYNMISMMVPLIGKYSCLCTSAIYPSLCLSEVFNNDVTVFQTDANTRSCDIALHAYNKNNCIVG